jgi:hypothetical protein
MALRSFAVVMQEMVARDPGKHGMPALPFFLGGGTEFPLIISFDGTGFGTGQFNTIAARNPYHPHSAQLLRVFGLGNCGDNRSGTTRLLGANQATINNMKDLSGERCVEYEEVDLGDGGKVDIKPHLYHVTDLAALRHTEHMSCSGICGCSRDFALRQTPKKPTDIIEMKELLAKCLEPSVIQRFVRSHTPVPGEESPRPCDVPGCKFGHGDDAAAIVEALSELLAMEKKLSADDSKKGKAAFSKWRMAHAASHFNVQPGEYVKPMFWHDFCDQILDALHLAELGLPKTPWKHGILNNASDDAREAISEQLKQWKHPLDTRRKDNNRIGAAKWYTGEKWHTFCAGESGSPGGPVAMATLVIIIADDMQQRGVDIGADETTAAAMPAAAPATATQQPKPKSGRGRAAFAFANAARAAAPPAAAPTAAALLVPPGQEDPEALQATRAQLRHVPSALQLAADPADIAIIKRVFGSRAQTIINTLLAWDAFFNWY